MKKWIVSMWLCFLLSGVLSGQIPVTQITGTVRTVSGNGIADVNVYVSRINERYAVYASCLSGQDGAFSLSFKTTDDSVRIHVSGINVAPMNMICVNRSQHRDLIVEERMQEIGEVVVRAPKMYSRGDTLSYNVASFQSGNDLSIAQVLKRLPGISVSDAGQISYKGQPIKKFYIEGLDLMKGRYGIATNNIDPNSISTIQVLENHQDIKALKNLKPEERASINLKLKSGVKGVFNLIATLGGGYDDTALWDNELVATYFRRNSQLLATYKGNDSGNDLEAELRSFDEADYSRTTNVSDIAMPSTPGINKRYYYFNRSHSATYNHVFRAGQDGELGINASCLYDRDERSNRSTTTTLLPDYRKNVVDERFSGIMRRNVAHGNITYMKNKERHYIKEALKFDYSSADGESAIFAGEDITQRNEVENYRLHNLFHLTNRTDADKGIDILSRVNVEKRPHSLSVTPNLFPDVLPADEMYQKAERRHFSTENRMDFLSAWVWGNLQIHPTAFFDYSYNELTSSLDTHRNNLGLHSVRTGVGVIANYRLRKFYVDVYVTENYLFLDLRHRDTDVKTDKHRLAFEPRLTMKYNVDGTNEIRLTGSLSHSTPVIENLYDRYILTSYRQLSVYENNELYQSQVQHYSLSYDYKNIVSMLFGGVDVNWSHHRPNVLYGSCYDGMVERIISSPTEETSDVLSVTLRGSKGFDKQKLKIGAECRYSYLDSPILLQNSVLRYHGNTLQAKMDVSFSPFGWLALRYDGAYYQSRTRMQGGGEMPKLKTMTNEASVEFALPHDISLGASISHYYNNLNVGHPSFLLGEANVRYAYKRWTFALSCNNLFNRRSYVRSTSGGVTENTSEYRIRPRSILMKIRYRIF